MEPAPPSTDLNELTWQWQGGVHVANDGRCLYMRESVTSMVAAAIFCTAIVVSSGWLSIEIFRKYHTVGETLFGILLLIITAVFIYIPWLTIRHGRWMITYDRGVPGTPGTPGEIRRSNAKTLPTTFVRGLSTRSVGGNPPRRTVVAELVDGTCESLGPVGISTWPAHLAQQAATWMGLPFRHSVD